MKQRESKAGDGSRRSENSGRTRRKTLLRVFACERRGKKMRRREAKFVVWRVYGNQPPAAEEVTTAVRDGLPSRSRESSACCCFCNTQVSIYRRLFAKNDMLLEGRTVNKIADEISSPGGQVRGLSLNIDNMVLTAFVGHTFFDPLHEDSDITAT